MQKKVIVTMREHDPGEVTHEWFSLHMKIPEHLFTAPASNHLDDAIVDART